MNKTQTKELLLGNIVTAIDILENSRDFAGLMPEVRVNIVYALPGAKTSKDVVAIDGRMTVVRGFPRASGLPRWGASDHMARLIIEVRKYNPSINAGINFKCDAGIIKVVEKYCKERGLTCGKIERAQEPAEVMAKDGASMPWKIGQLATKYGNIPGLFYEGEGWGKEPLYVAIGKDAVEVAKIAIEIAKRYKAARK